MRVMQINSVCGVGSTGRIATDIHNILIEQGHKSYIAYGRDLPKSCDKAIRIGGKFDNYTHVVKTRIFDKHGFASKRATVEFINKVKELNPDIIHLHNIHGYYLNIEILFEYLKEADKPVIWTLHDCWSFTGHCAYFDYVACDKWKTGCYDCPQKKGYPSSFLLDNSKENYRRKKELFTGLKNMTIVTPSNWLADLVKQSYLKEYQVQVINNGIDLNLFMPTESNFREENDINNKFMILGVANVWDERKGLRYFLDLSKTLNDDEIIVLVGLSEKQKKQLPKNIIGITRTSNIKELVEIYSAADVFVNPTLEDNFPTTNLEALACGTPIITFNTGGSVESVYENTGYVVEKGNLKDMKIAIDKVKARNSKISSCDFCIERAKNYNKNEKFNEYIELYIERLKNV